MKNWIRNSESWDSRIRPLLDALEEHKNELDFYLENGIIDMKFYMETLEEAANLTCATIQVIADDIRDK